jgi:glutamine synthetase adenylyltransferase
LDTPAPASIYAEWLPRIGLLEREIPAVLTAEAYSRRQLQLARECLSPLADDSGLWQATATFALGSLGRLEASRESDLDLAFVYDGDRIDHAQAQAVRAQVIARLSNRLQDADSPHPGGGFDIPE